MRGRRSSSPHGLKELSGPLHPLAGHARQVQHGQAQTLTLLLEAQAHSQAPAEQVTAVLGVRGRGRQGQREGSSWGLGRPPSTSGDQGKDRGRSVHPSPEWGPPPPQHILAPGQTGAPRRAGLRWRWSALCGARSGDTSQAQTSLGSRNWERGRENERRRSQDTSQALWVRCVAAGKHSALSGLHVHGGRCRATGHRGWAGEACCLPEPVDQHLGARVLHGEDVAWGKPAGQVLRGQSEQRVVDGQDACGGGSPLSPLPTHWVYLLRAPCPHPSPVHSLLHAHTLTSSLIKLLLIPQNPDCPVHSYGDVPSSP